MSCGLLGHVHACSTCDFMSCVYVTCVPATQNTPTPSFTMTAGGAPSLLTKISHGQEAMLKDGASNYMVRYVSI